MANKKISQLASAGTLSGDELFEAVQSGTNKKTTLDDLKTFAQSDSLVMAGTWNFSDNGGGFPTASKASLIYVAISDHGSPGDADFVPEGAWMISKTAGANSFNDYYYK